MYFFTTIYFVMLLIVLKNPNGFAHILFKISHALKIWLLATTLRVCGILIGKEINDPAKCGGDQFYVGKGIYHSDAFL